MKPLITLPGKKSPVSTTALRLRLTRLGFITEPMAAVALLPILATLLASTADIASIGMVIAALGLVFYQASAAMGGRYIV